MEKESESSAAARVPTSARATNSFISSLALLKNRSVFGIFLGFLAYDYVWFVYISWLPGYLMLERKFTTRRWVFMVQHPYHTDVNNHLAFRSSQRPVDQAGIF